MKAKETDAEAAIEPAQRLADGLKEIAEPISNRYSRADDL
jgi:hypothetical protein